MSGTWTRYDILTDGAGGAEIHWSTNDDNDDGYDDGDVASLVHRFPTVEAALRHAGHKSRRGFYGQPVEVTLDGERL